MIKRKPKSKEKIKKEKEDSFRMKEFFLSIWKIRPHYSELSGVFLGKVPYTLYFHHIIPSRKEEKGKYDPENIILLTGDEHSTVEMNKFKYEEINKRRIKLLEKYAK